MKKSFIIWGIIGLISIIVIISIILFLYVIYPVKHKDLINKYAKIYKLNSSLVCSVINVESNFNKDAVSKVGAVGLMQIMPETAREIAGKLGVDDYVDEMLFAPDINIRFGCYYLSYLSNMYNGNLVNVVAAYNAGFNNVNEWLKNENYSNNGTITNPPFEETKNYLKKINKNLSVYEKRI